MGLFSANTPKRVTKEEWERITENLYGKLDERERNLLEMFFRADLFEPNSEYGITQSEFSAGMEWLRQNMRRHDFEESDLDLIEQQFAEHLKD